MPAPDPIGLVHYDEPRAVQVREPENITAIHSAIHCGVNIYTDNKKQADYLMSMWPYIMASLSNTVAAMVQSMPAEA